MDDQSKTKAQLIGDLAGLHRKVAELQRMCATASEGEERFRGFFNAITEYCYMISPAGLILDVNRAALEALGYEYDELIGKPLASIYTAESREAMKSAFATWKQTGKVRDTELVIQTKEGRRRTVILNAMAVRDPDGSLRHSISVQHDITERKRREKEQRIMDQQIQQTQRLESLGVLAGGIAHDFNNILMAILGHADLALDELPRLSPTRESLSEIKEASRRAADLCTEMLAYSGKGGLVKQDIDLRDLIEQILHMLRTCISKKALLNLNVEEALPPIHADPTQIRQILMTLVINASEAIGDRSGVIAISTGAVDCTADYLAETYLNPQVTPGLFVCLEVADTGSGMDEEIQARLFEPFFTTKFAGRGLGLAAVMGIVRAHDGTLKVHSEVGKGTTFKVMFPAVASDDRLQGDGRKSEDASAWYGEGLVLLVDDEETVRAVSGRMLQRLGFVVLPAQDGRQALDLYREHRAKIRLVLLDLTMPHVDGEETYRRLRDFDPMVRVVLASGYSEDDVASRFAGKGLAGVIQKPYSLDKLRNLLSGLMPGTEETSTKDL